MRIMSSEHLFTGLDLRLMENLRTTLEDLHTRLAGLEQVDDATRTQIGTLLQDLQRLAGQSQPPAAGDMETLRQRADDLVLQLESEHPQVTSWLGQLADLVASLGI